MKNLTLFNLFLFLILIVSTSFNSVTICLCKKDEKNIITFKIVKSSKSVSICEGQDNKYLVYRFGKKDNIELEFPNKRNESSWEEFYYDSYHRGGGYQNSARSTYSLSFKNQDVYYIINHSISSIDSTENGIQTKIEIEIITDNKIIKLNGEPSTLIGSLGLINEEKIKNKGHVLDK